MKKLISIGLCLEMAAVVTVNAANPASTAYVDKAFMMIQQQIDSIKLNPSFTLAIGQHYGGGTIIYLSGNTTLRKGLIAAPTDANCAGNCLWATNNTNGISAAEGTLLFDGGPLGNNNTQNIINTIGGNEAQAAAAATNYTTPGEENCTTTTISCTGWYLPAISELSLIFVFFGDGVLTNFNTITPYYWSSTQNSFVADDALDVSFDPTSLGTQGSPSKQTPISVRAVRAFTY